MTTTPDPADNEHGYVIDAEDAAEMARLLEQDALITRAMGGLFPERGDKLAGMNDILDVACGPGGWALNVAREYPDSEVTGIDISERMIKYARAHAQARRLPNVNFQVMDILQPLAFADASFDLVNARMLFAVMNPESWASLLREMARVCRPGGTIRLTEVEFPITTSPRFEELTSKFLQAMHQTHRSFAPDARNFCITPVLIRLLRDAGCEDVYWKAHGFNFAAQTDAHEGFMQDFMIAYQLASPFLLGLELLKKEEFEMLHQQMVAEMLTDDFCAIMYGLTACGTRPYEKEDH